MAFHFYELRTKSKMGIIVLSTIAVVAGGFLIVLGLTILLGLSALVATLAIGASIYRKLTGYSLFRRRGAAPRRLDEALEVFPHPDETTLLKH